MNSFCHYYIRDKVWTFPSQILLLMSIWFNCFGFLKKLTQHLCLSSSILCSDQCFLTTVLLFVLLLVLGGQWKIAEKNVWYKCQVNDMMRGFNNLNCSLSINHIWVLIVSRKLFKSFIRAVGKSSVNILHPLKICSQFNLS